MGCSKNTQCRLLKLKLWMAAAVMVFGVVSAGYAQSYSNSWATKMFSEAGTSMTHNFGDIALHAEAEQRFKFRNIYKDDVVILMAQSSCSCTKVTVPNKVIKSGEVGEIIARVDTSGKTHIGRRKATITVQFSKPYSAEVQLQVSSNIRSDVVFDPGVVEFGGVTQGNQVTKTVYLTYSGTNPNWKIKALKRNSQAIHAEAKESKERKGKTYQIDIQLHKAAEPGYINDLLQIVTNESGSAGIFLPVHGLVYSPLSVKPTHLQLGVIHPNETITRNLVVSGSKPFKIAEVDSDDSRIGFKTADQVSIVQVIPVTFTVPAEERAGEFKKSIRIKTTLNDFPELNVPVFGIISADNSAETESAHAVILPEEMENAVEAYRNFSGGPVIASFEDIDLQTIISSIEAVPAFSPSEEISSEADEEPVFAPVSNKFGRHFLTLQKLEMTEDSDDQESESIVEHEKSEEDSGLQVGNTTNKDENGWFPIDENKSNDKNGGQKTASPETEPEPNESKIAYKNPSL